MNPKPVQVQTAYFANLVAHAFAVMGLRNSRDDYVPQLGALRVRFARRAGEVMEAGTEVGFAAPLAGGPLFTFVYQVPQYAGVRDPDQVRAVFSASVRALREGSFRALKLQQPACAPGWQAFYPVPWMEFLFSGDLEAKAVLVDAMGSFLVEIARDHFDAWWPGWEIELSARARAVTSGLALLGIIGRWEQHLRIPYPHRQLRVVLSRPDRTSASSFGPDGIVVGESHDNDAVMASALHEVGVRMFDPPRALRLCPGPADIGTYGRLLRCVEAAACAEKPSVAALAGRLDLAADDGFARNMKLESLIEQWRRTGGRDPVVRLVKLFKAAA